MNRLADFGMCCSCLLPRKLLEEAPVGPNAGGDGGNSGFQVFGRPGRDKKDDGGKPTTMAFSGTGATLGSKDSGQGNSMIRVPFLGSLRGGSKGSGEDSLTDRREKARMAALARMNAESGSGSE